MANYRKHEVFSGLFIIAALAAFSLFAFKVGDLKFDLLFGTDVLKCEAYFADVKSLEKDAEVVAGGQRIGSVINITLVKAEDLKKHAGSRPATSLVRVTFEISDMTLSLNPENASVQVVRDGFIGTNHLVLDPGEWPVESTPLAIEPSRFTQPVRIATGVGTSLEDVIAQAPPLIEKANVLLDELIDTAKTINNKIVSEDENVGILALMGELDTAIKEGQKFLGSLNELMKTDYEEGIHQRIILPLEKLLKNADSSVTQLTDKLLNDTLAGVDKLILDAQKAINNADKAIVSAGKMLEEAGPKVDGILTDLKDTSGKLKIYLEDLKNDLSGLMKNVNGAITENRADLRVIVSRMRRTMWQAEMAMRKIRANPAVILWGDDETDLEATSTDETGLRKSGRAKPYGQRDEGSGK